MWFVKFCFASTVARWLQSVFSATLGMNAHWCHHTSVWLVVFRADCGRQNKRCSSWSWSSEDCDMTVIKQKVYVLTLILHMKTVCEEDRWEEGVVRGDVRLNPEETKTPELRRCVILFSPFLYGATHWSNRIVRLSFISKSSFVMTALPFWRGLLVRHDTDQKPGAVARQIENKPGWLNDASLLEACFVWVKDVIFDAVLSRRKTHIVLNEAS